MKGARKSMRPVFPQARRLSKKIVKLLIRMNFVRRIVLAIREKPAFA